MSLNSLPADLAKFVHDALVARVHETHDVLMTKLRFAVDSHTEQFYFGPAVDA
jgi:hypothetical protein